MTAIRAIPLIVAMVIPPLSVAATPIGVDVDPPSPGTTDSISLSTHLRWNTSGYLVTGPSASFPSLFAVNLVIFVSSPAPGEIVLQVITEAMRDTELGVLPAGMYTYTVSEIQTQRGTGLTTLDPRNISGSFAVVPEPAPALQLALGLALLTLRRGRTLDRSRQAALLH